ncbi:hypothetical protein E2C01_068441 [Portunus trituberculatus]|uniref:Uncharacterized protein n=1 Tax=Portunus trituberculatus TaxID=210409 RepID=A0A5B7HW57_PORTR|nr:hypothetical protein [Portunus trituberculatus]
MAEERGIHLMSVRRCVREAVSSALSGVQVKAASVEEVEGKKLMTGTAGWDLENTRVSRIGTGEYLATCLLPPCALATDWPPCRREEWTRVTGGPGGGERKRRYEGGSGGVKRGKERKEMMENEAANHEKEERE